MKNHVNKFIKMNLNEYENLIIKVFSEIHEEEIKVEDSYTNYDGINIVMFDHNFGFYVSKDIKPFTSCKILRIEPNLPYGRLKDFISESIHKIPINLCIKCGCDIGESNSRQYCCKTYCDKIFD